MQFHEKYLFIYLISRVFSLDFFKFVRLQRFCVLRRSDLANVLLAYNSEFCTGNFILLQRATLHEYLKKSKWNSIPFSNFLVEIANISTNNKSSPIFLLQGLTTHNLSIYLTFFLFNNNQCSFLQNSSCLLIKC